MKKVFSVFLAISLLTPFLFSINITAKGATTTIDYLTFTEYDTYCELTRCDKSAAGDIIIPSNVEFDGVPLPVKSIKSYAFDFCTNITNITIPNSVTTISDYAFYYRTSLTNITIPDSVTTIGDYAFYNCTSLTNITIPDSVLSIGKSAFSNCTGLKRVSIGKGVLSVGEEAFSSCSNLTDLKVYSDKMSIGVDAFKNCSLTYSKYDEGLYIGNEENNYLVFVKSINGNIDSCILHENTRILSYFAFNNCTKVKNVVLPDNLVLICEKALYN